MKKVSLFFLVPGQSGSNLFSSLFLLTFTVQPPSVSRQRCHRNIRLGCCYLMKEEKTEIQRERESVSASAIKAQFYKRSEAIEPTADSSVRMLEQNDTR